MPCYTIQRSAIELKAASADLLMEGLRIAGYTVQERSGVILFRREKDGISGSYKDGRLTLQADWQMDATAIGNEIKRGHGLANVRSTSRRFGWQLNEGNATQMVATKRGM